jgi:hypothetical protein
MSSPDCTCCFDSAGLSAIYVLCDEWQSAKVPQMLLASSKVGVRKYATGAPAVGVANTCKSGEFRKIFSLPYIHCRIKWACRSFALHPNSL